MSTKTAHPHAALMALYAQDAAETAEPWERWEWREYGNTSYWRPCTHSPRWDLNFEYRRKPKTIRIGDFDVPEPLREPPAYSTEYHTVKLDPWFDHYPGYRFYWKNEENDRRRLAASICHLTQEAADLHARALLSLMQVKS